MKKKELFIGLIIGIIVGVLIGIIIGMNIKKNSKINNGEVNYTLNELDHEFVGKWEYGTKYEDMLPELTKKLDEYKGKYETKKSNSWGNYCGTKDGIIISKDNNNTTLIINKDGSVEYIEYHGYIDGNCEAKIYIATHYKGTFDNSQIVFKQRGNDEEWVEFRESHNIYLVDNETLHYKYNDENPNSSTILFIRRK